MAGGVPCAARGNHNNIPGGQMPQTNNGAGLGFEQTLWAAADKLRGHLDAAEYKHVVLDRSLQ